jgi:hypothetical protein
LSLQRIPDVSFGHMLCIIKQPSEWYIMPIEEIKAAYSEGTIMTISRIHAFNMRFLAS